MTLRLNGSTSGYTEINAPAVAGSNTLVLPTGNGSSGQVLSTNGSGTLSWVSPIESGALYYRLDSNLAGANVNTAQSIFGVGVTLAASTVFQFQTYFILLKTAGATSHTVSYGFGGTATVNNIQYGGLGTWQPLAYSNGIISGPVSFDSNTVSAVQGTTAIAAANSTARLYVSGTVSINAGGTFIPQYTLSAAPGGAYSTVAGSYIRFAPIGAAGSASSQGTWS